MSQKVSFANKMETFHFTKGKELQYIILMQLSDMQIKLIQASKNILVRNLHLTNEDAISVISKAIKSELHIRKTILELLEISALSERTSFVRAVVKNVQDQIMKNPEWRSNIVDRYIEKFYQTLHEIMHLDGKET